MGTVFLELFFSVLFGLMCVWFGHFKLCCHCPLFMLLSGMHRDEDMFISVVWAEKRKLLVCWTSGRENSTGLLAVLAVMDHCTNGNLEPLLCFS